MKVGKNKLSKKLLLSFMGAIIAIVMFVTLVGVFVTIPMDKDTLIKAMYLSQVIMLILVIVAFYQIVNRMVIRRLEKLTKAMEEVTGGNYEITVDVLGSDELSSLTESFNKMTAELKANAFLSRDFTRYVSHEFKTPICIIRNYAELTQLSSDSSETSENMDIIISEADRLSGLSKDMLDLCKLDSTTIIEKKDTFSPAAQIRSVILDSQVLWNEKNIDIALDTDDIEITSNETLLFRVWQNIIGNAIKFCEQNGKIDITLKQDNGSLKCEISDNGIGMTDEEKANIFTPFYSGNKTQNKGGSGLGLSLSMKIVEKLGGTIQFESETGKGTTFIIKLPI